MAEQQLTFSTVLNPERTPEFQILPNRPVESEDKLLNPSVRDADQLRLSRRNGPVTSFQAAEKLRKSGRLGRQEKSVYDALQLNDGSTSAELALLMECRDRYRPSRRLSGIESKGLVSRGRTRICRATGNRCLVWWVLNGTERV